MEREDKVPIHSTSQEEMNKRTSLGQKYFIACLPEEQLRKTREEGGGVAFRRSNGGARVLYSTSRNASRASVFTVEMEKSKELQ